MELIMRLLLMLALAIGSVLGLAGCEIGLFPTNALEQDEVAAFIGAPFPADATNIYTEGESALDTIAYARFDLPADQVAGYLQAIGLTGQLTPNATPFRGGGGGSSSMSWWQPPTDTSSDMRFSGLPDNTYLNNKYYSVAVLNPNEEVATVYISVFNT